MKKYLSLIAGLLLTVNIQAADKTQALDPGANSILTAPAYITLVSVAAGNVGTVTVNLYDLATAATNLITGEYTTRTSYTTNWVSSFTNTLGNVQSVTNSGYWTTSTTVAAATNEARKVLTFLVSPNTTVEKTVAIRNVKGLSAYASTNATISVTYR